MKYEYLVAKGPLFSIVGTRNEIVFEPAINGEKSEEWENEPLQDFLNHYGAEGWDVCNIFFLNSTWCVVLKRVKENA